MQGVRWKWPTSAASTRRINIRVSHHRPLEVEGFFLTSSLQLLQKGVTVIDLPVRLFKDCQEEMIRLKRGQRGGREEPESVCLDQMSHRKQWRPSSEDSRSFIDQTGLQRLLPSFMQFAFADAEAEAIYRQYYAKEKRSDFHILIKILLLSNLVLLALFTFVFVTSPDSTPTNTPSTNSLISQPSLDSYISSNFLETIGVSDGYASEASDQLVHVQSEGGGNDQQSAFNRSQSLLICLICLCLSLSLLGVAGFLCSWSASPSLNKELSSSVNLTIWLILPIIMWIIQLIHVTCDLWLFPRSRLPSDSVSWILVYTYTIYVIFPLRLRYCFILSTILSLYHIVMVSTSSHSSLVSNFGSTLTSNILLFVAVNILGIMSFFFYERQQRRSFLETCQSLEAKLILEEESQEQERLLLSVLPKHVAAEIREDLGSMVTGQFKKIYMSRHENVSILFADIVGFTAISSTCSAPELVRILNELFARFDKLSDKYHQLRIKILGDCYYCISGAPRERSDHAVLCVHMGLSMVDAIQCVREETKSPVDMRVGIHTGGLLAGVMGQKQWQFDVYSKDVELANKMESGGVPGKVHISEKTYSFLNGEFEVIDGDGSSREEAIRLAGIKTYLVTKVLKEYPEGTLDEHKSTSALPSPRHSIKSDVGQIKSAFNQPDGEDVYIEEGIIGPGGEIINVEEYNRRLLHELLYRESGTNVRKNSNTFTLGFSDANYEHQWKYTKDITSCISLLGLPITLITISLVYLLIGPPKPVIVATQLLNNLLLIIISVTCCSVAFKYCCPNLAPFTQACTSISDTVQSKSVTRLLIVVFMISIWLITLVTTAYFCPDDDIEASITIPNWYEGSSNASLSPSSLMLTSNKLVHQIRHYRRSPLTNVAETNFIIPASRAESPVFISLPSQDDGKAAFLGFTDQAKNEHYCDNASYLTFFTITGMISITVITRISFIVKKLLIMLLMVSQILLNLRRLESSLRHYDSVMYSNDGKSSSTSPEHESGSSGSFVPHPHFLNLMIIIAAIVLSVLNRQFELMSRRLFLWQKQVEEQKEQVSDMRKKNEALVYNILPPHVAIHFLGRKNMKDEELYSKSYEAVGVLFAAMPNFSDFYTEESVNNQGLECLRFLNEVISDYDALLEQERFKDVIKIKTIGSSYMAASGLNDTDTSQNSKAVKSPDSLEARLNKWQHLAQLTEFALSLKETLSNINKESFNNFVLRIGINCGPITAGVIGARKPHYDMWGNTVNVASRMESTGKAGSIQVVQETRDVLQEFGYGFEQRGLVSVKGKGMLRTFYLISGPPRK